MFGLSVALPLSVVAAVLLHLMPVGFIWSAYQPHYLLLVALFWVSRHPSHCGIGCAASLGLLADLVYGNWIGQQLLSFALAAYLLLAINRSVLSPTLVQQSLIVAVLAALVSLIQVGWMDVDGAQLALLPALVGALIGGLLWPLIALLLEPLYDSGEIR